MSLLLDLIELILHYDDVIMSTIASQITSLTIVYSTVYSGADQSKHQSYASLAFVWGNHRGPMNSPHKWPVTRTFFSFDDVIMAVYIIDNSCLRMDRGQAYGGRVSQTREGVNCLPWEQVLASTMGAVPFHFVEESLRDNYYCRNPDRDWGGPWCFTSSFGDRDFCDIPRCGQWIIRPRSS